MDAKKLLELSTQALELDLDPEQRLERILRYSDALGALIESGALEQLDAAMLQRLSEQHALAMQMAQSSLDSTGAEIKALRSRAKGFLAYKDVFQKRPSIMRTRKG